jgi:hypothetical protein
MTCPVLGARDVLHFLLFLRPSFEEIAFGLLVFELMRGHELGQKGCPILEHLTDYSHHKLTSAHRRTDPR